MIDSVAATAALAAVLFAATNMDTLLTSTALVAANRHAGRGGNWRIWCGQCVGMVIVVVIALLVAASLAHVSAGWLAAIGVVPILLGLKGLWACFRSRLDVPDGDVAPQQQVGVVGVAGLTIGSGADNLAAYTPVFRTDDMSQLAVTLGVFTIGAAVLCVVGAWCGSRRLVILAIRRFGRWTVPVVFLVVGVAAVYHGLSSI
ncbi:cadmium resistance transporter [Mycobacterium sp. NPDC006124]|uniref:cadmium resistance transporter n=1 Tax=Mycobacterium sp. NPDC006124 TaxID=3156729 RepID=UPI0033BF188A